MFPGLGPLIFGSRMNSPLFFYTDTHRNWTLTKARASQSILPAWPHWPSLRCSVSVMPDTNISGLLCPPGMFKLRKVHTGHMQKRCKRHQAPGGGCQLLSWLQLHSKHLSPPPSPASLCFSEVLFLTPLPTWTLLRLTL